MRYADKVKYVRCHSAVWILTNGPIPKDLQLDHINRVKTDNRIENLRLVTSAVNNQNKVEFCTNKLGMKHISKRKDRGLYTIKVIRNGVKQVEYATTIEEAVAKRDAVLNYCSL